MADKLQVTIVGLGLVGASAGMALRRYQDRVVVIGHDRTPALASSAKKLAAVDRTDWNLIGAVSGADRILLALPLSELRDTLQAIAGDLKPGCILLDTADVKGPAMAWAAEVLPETVHFVGGHPILLLESLNPEEARADLFQNKLFCLTADPRTDDKAVRLAADLVEAMGARPFFVDAVEHDGMVAGVEQLPALLAGGLMEIVLRSPGWQDTRKVAGGQFYSSTLLAAGDGRAAVDSLLANRENTLRWLDELLGKLQDWRKLLDAGDEKTLTEAFARGLEEGQRWVVAQASGQWEEGAEGPPMPTSGDMWRNLIGFGRQRRPPDQRQRK